uniref:CSON001764 protein n=1 Tax=Culicoides sonorensis TaxID=179676 RepID=A0A336K8P4_CULSO
MELNINYNENICRACLGPISVRRKGVLLNDTMTRNVKFKKKHKPLALPFHTVSYLEAFKCCTGITVHETEPQQICGICAIDLNQAYNFVDKCFKAQGELESLMMKKSSHEIVKTEVIEIKQEIVDEPHLTAPEISVQNEIVSDEKVFVENIVQEILPSDTDDKQAAEEKDDESNEKEDDESNEKEVEEEFPVIETNFAKNRPIKCDLCKKILKGFSGLRNHYTSRHKDIPPTSACVHCKEKMHTQVIERHTLFCRKRGKLFVGKFLCPVCGAMNTREHMRHHMRLERQKKLKLQENLKYICHFCGVECSLKFTLKKHIMVQHLNIFYKCKLCSVEYKTKQQLNRHIKKTHPEVKSRVYSCYFCDFTTTDAREMLFHRPSHTVGEEYKCRVCSKQFLQKSHLDTHMKSHSNERPFACDICGKTYKTKANLGQHQTSHMLVHTMDERRKNPEKQIEKLCINSEFVTNYEPSQPHQNFYLE